MSWDASDEDTFERWEAERRARRGQEAAGRGGVAGEIGAPGSRGGESALATCLIRGCGLAVSRRDDRYCRSHQAQVDRMAALDWD